MRSISNDEYMAEVYRNDQTYAIEMLNNILEDGELDELLIALRHMSKAFGGVSQNPEKAPLNDIHHIYRALSEKDNLDILSLSALLRTMGMRLSVEPLVK